MATASADVMPDNKANLGSFSSGLETKGTDAKEANDSFEPSGA
jgi:hypothetical protein